MERRMMSNCQMSSSVGCAAITILRFFLSILCCTSSFQTQLFSKQTDQDCLQLLGNQEGFLAFADKHTQLTCSCKKGKIEDLFWGKGEEGN